MLVPPLRLSRLRLPRPCRGTLGSILLLCSCSGDTPPGDPDAATHADTGADTSGAGGTGGVGGREDGAAGKSGAGGVAGASGGSAGAAGGSSGGSAGRAGASGTGGVAGTSMDGQAGTSSGGRDAAADRSDGRDASSPDHDADASADSASDGRDASSTIDAAYDSPDVASDGNTPPSDGGACSPLPTTGVYAKFRVVSDVFYASITNATGIDQAIALWQGQSQAKIPVGQLECNGGTYNCGWTWSMSPASITFAEITIEVCDATPSYVQGNCASFPNGTYCPWSAELIELRDCRAQATCPIVPR